MKKEILTGIVGLMVSVLAFGAQTGNSLLNIPTVEIDSIVYIEEEKPVELGFDTAMYLPEGFNAYGIPANAMDISYIEEEYEVVLDFDINEYLPKAFDPYKMYFDFDSIPYIEEGEIIECDFEIYEVLPSDLNSESTF